MMGRPLTGERLTTHTIVRTGRVLLGEYIRRAAAGDVDAFMVFYDATCDDAYRLARCHLGDADAAAGALVLTYVRAYRTAHTFEHAGRSPRAWLLSILQREVADLGTRRDLGTTRDHEHR